MIVSRGVFGDHLSRADRKAFPLGTQTRYQAPLDRHEQAPEDMLELQDTCSFGEEG